MIDLETNEDFVLLVQRVLERHIPGIVAPAESGQAVAAFLGVLEKILALLPGIVDQDADLVFQDFRDLGFYLGVVRIQSRLLRQFYGSHHKGPDLCEWNGRQTELALPDVQDGNLLSHRLALNQRRGDARSGLADPKSSYHGFRQFNVALVFVSPTDKVDPLGNHVLLDAILSAPSPITVLVQGKNVEPGLRSILLGTRKGQMASPPHAVEPLVAHAAQAIQGHLGVALSQQNRVDSYVLGVLLLAKVIDEVDHVQEIEGGVQLGVSSVSARIVVVSVNRKDGEIDGII
mmetsp:Transcript_7190/g.14847  ORF Transcript_7190/g.14847 Transcript_7190/m.14847 type:complete len:289 (+) Transcript_7190:1228-2094(+)